MIKIGKYEYDRVGDFSEGKAWARKGNREFHINLDGSRAYKQSFDWVVSFFKGKAMVSKDGKEFYIDHNGKKIKEVRNNATKVDKKSRN